ncbi:eIF-1a domain containing protein [Trichuris trichiura]|uniref:Probable RNA-binding protein EIF1AD n=1 Tax=Trichuris trichiura TaxID=36087 RepID=A0A077ZHZ8_TRITR|nr:eIF-1a domain containing protein [Trichuris trichiura]
MSIVTKRKYVEHEILNDFVLPKPPMFIARVTAPRGNNLHEAESESGERFLVSMPTKYRKHIWIKRGMYVLCEPIAEGNKVKAEIYRVLLDGNIRYIYDEGLWPSVFPLPRRAAPKPEYNIEEDFPPSASESSSKEETPSDSEESSEEEEEESETEEDTASSSEETSSEQSSGISESTATKEEDSSQKCSS